MSSYLAIFEFLGTTEMLVIAVVALIIFGPRKLPELGRTVGKSLAEFKRASEDFKRTWEREVEIDRIERDLRADVDGDGVTSPAALGAGAGQGVGVTSPDGSVAWEERTIARGGDFVHTETGEEDEPPRVRDGGDPAAREQGAPDESARKHDWL